MSSGGPPAPPLLEARLGPAHVWCTGKAQGNVADHVGVSEHLTQTERLAGAAGFLKLRDFSPLQALEVWLEEARKE